MKQKIILILIIFIGTFCHAQNMTNPKKIKFKDNFEHKYSNTKFPEKFIDKYTLTDVYAFDKKKENIGVTYKNKDCSTDEFTVYIYPAGFGGEDRLRKEYLNSMQVVANFTENGLGAN